MKIVRVSVKMQRLYTHPCGGYAKLSTRSDGMWLDSLYVPKMYRRQGIGRQLLLRVLADADRFRIKMFLTVSGDEDAMTDEQLMHWYVRFGFHYRNALVLERTPNGVIENDEVVLRQM